MFQVIITHDHRPHSRQVSGARCTGGRGSPVMSWILLKVFIGAGQPPQHGEVRDTNLAWVRPVHMTPYCMESGGYSEDWSLCCPILHSVKWKCHFYDFTTFLSPVAHKIFILTIFGATKDKNFVNMPFLFQSSKNMFDEHSMNRFWPTCFIAIILSIDAE